MFKKLEESKDPEFARMDKEAQELSTALIKAVASFYKLKADEKLSHKQAEVAITALCMGFLGAAFNSKCPPEIVFQLFMKFFECAYRDEVKIMTSSGKRDMVDEDSRITHTMDGKPIVGHC